MSLYLLYTLLALPFTHTVTAEPAKTLTDLVTVNNANKIATRLVYDMLWVESVRANMISGAPMPRHQITVCDTLEQGVTNRTPC